MILTSQQEKGLQIAIQRYKDHEPYTVIAGYAGTGKSTLVQFIIQALNLYPDEVAYIAFTGKAALVLQSKGCPNATTAHKFLYYSHPLPNGTFYHRPKKLLDHPYKLVVVDEISMLPNELWELLLSHNIHVIALGDPYQLPPVGNDNGVLAKPHIFLDEIMRQEAESEIIRITMDIRNQKPLHLMKGNEVQILSKSELVDGMYSWADQIIVGKNETRHKINMEMRKKLYDTDDPTPLDGDRIICLRNDWHCMTSNNTVLINGQLGTIQNPQVKPAMFINKMIIADFLPDEDTESFKDLQMDYKLFTEGEPSITIDNFKRIPKIWHPRQFDYGYCITCHRAQGSEYNKVLVIEEYLRGSDHGRWLYTACTRAAQKLVLIKS